MRFPQRFMPLLGPAILGLVTASTGLAGFEEARRSITADEIRAHLILLASDQLTGRAPGTTGADIAAEYIAARFIAAGLEPLEGTYFQDVPVRAVTVDPATVAVAFEGEGDPVTAEYPGDIVVWPGVDRAALQVSGDLVFAGHGIRAPGWGWDDFAGRDLTGKVLLIMDGDPPAPPDDPELFAGRALTFFGHWRAKVEEAGRQGASGVLIIHRPEVTGYDWTVVQTSWAGESHALIGTRAVPLQGWITEDFAGRLLQRAGLDLHELLVRAARPDFRPVDTGLVVRGRLDGERRRVPTPNVAGFLPGKDEALRGETVAFVAHYDHLGTGRPADGDSIYNGAYDNASGVSVLLELAEAFARLDQRDRGVLFLATTEEEAGLLGSRHYVANPLRPVSSTVAVINIDGVNLWGETDDAIALGVELSTLGRSADVRATELGMRLRPDPAPEKGGFFRSDHFPFAHAGVPVLSIQHGLRFRGRPQGWGEALMTEWTRDHYHRPSDELDPDADLSGAVQQAWWAFGIGYDVVNGSERPRWIERARARILPPRP